MKKKHTKHAKLTLRKSGVFAPNELSLVGVKCGTITNLVKKLSVILFEKVKLAYIDASHDKESVAPILDVYTYHASGNALVSSKLEKNTFNDRIRFSKYDLAVVNGNHYTAKQQIVFLDPEKENSISKRIAELDAIQFFIKTTSDAVVFDCLKEMYPACLDLPIYDLENTTAIAAHIEKNSKAKYSCFKRSCIGRWKKCSNGVG